jgi:histidine triad (HIT) family protein
MNPECIFCKIIAGKAPGEIIYHDDLVTAFNNIHPIAPVHILIVTNHHLNSVNEAAPPDEPTLGRLITVARQLAEQHGISQSGYRLVINTGRDGGQSIYHLHMHLIGGKRFPFLLEGL